MPDGYLLVYLYQQELITTLLTIIASCMIFIVVYIIYKEVVK